MSASFRPAPLSSFQLDVGRDDYYGHSGSWPDVQESEWLRRLDARHPLSLTLLGRGIVRGDLPGVECVASCRTEWDEGTTVALTARPGRGWRFVRWQGACVRVRDRCVVTMDAASHVSALFAPVFYRLSVAVDGRGRVTSGRDGLDCASRCVRKTIADRPVRLRAVAAKGWRLRGWSGACRGARPTCTVLMQAATSVRAVFVRRVP